MHKEITSRLNSLKPATIRFRIVCLRALQLRTYSSMYKTILGVLFCVGEQNGLSDVVVLFENVMSC